jgi:small subunit ribosomal protein S16
VVKLRLKRFGRTHRPFYRLSAMDIRTPRNGMSIEELGTYDPVEKDEARQIQFNADRVKHWLDAGAQPSETVVSLLRKAGIDLPKGLAANLEAGRARSAKNVAVRNKRKAEKEAKVKAQAEAHAAHKAKKAAAGEGAPAAEGEKKEG